MIQDVLIADLNSISCFLTVQGIVGTTLVPIFHSTQLKNTMNRYNHFSPDGNASETVVPVTREHKFETVIYNEAGDAYPCEVSYIYHDDPDYRNVTQITTNMFECTLKESEVEWQIKEEIRGLEKGYEVEFLGDIEYVKS